jgi:hypothetical protein
MPAAQTKRKRNATPTSRGRTQSPRSVANVTAPRATNLPPDLRTATRLQKRLKDQLNTHGAATPSPLQLTKYLQERSALLQKSFTLVLEADASLERKEFKIAFKDHPEWITFHRNDMHLTIDSRQVEEFLEENVRSLLPEPSTAVLIETPTDGELRATVEGVARDGYLINVEATAGRILEALNTPKSQTLNPKPQTNSKDSNSNDQNPSGEDSYLPTSLPAYSPTIGIALEKIEGNVVDARGELQDLKLLSQGRSRFTGSPAARIANIKKAVEMHLNNSYIAPGEYFSYLKAIGPVSQSRGWSLALGIFNGVDLAPTPGGGVCQVSTTFYRAILGAGLPIKKQANHSIYVDYYAAYGDGLDATVFGNGVNDSNGLPGGKDLVFLNDTGYPILIQAEVVDDEIFVNIYGRPDGRRVALEGPYRRDEIPPHIRDLYGKPFPTNSITWLQTITKPDGTREENVLVSKYNKPIPGATPKGKEPLRLAGYHAAL